MAFSKQCLLFTSGMVLSSVYAWQWNHTDAKGVSPLISESIFRNAIQYIDQGKYQQFPRASEGKTPVFFPPDLPVVLKKSGYQCESRLEKMREAQEICDQNRYTHLVIPKARIHGNFLIEERLPVSDGERSTFKDLAFYLENRDKMTPAIRELTGFLCQATMTDLECSRHPALRKAPTPIARFDNLIPYLDKDGEYKFGLVDLEHFSKDTSFGSSWRTLITFFPYHFEEIMQEAAKFYPCLNLNRKEYENKRDAALKTYEIGYTGHQRFLKEKNIQQANGNALAHMSDARKNALEQSLIEKMHEWYNYDAEGDYFNYNPRALTPEETAEMANLVHKSFPQTLDLLQERLSRNIRRCNDKSKDLVDCRSFVLRFPDAYSDAIKHMNEAFHMEERNHGKYGEVLARHLLEEMAKGGDIYDYANRAYGENDLIRL